MICLWVDEVVILGTRQKFANYVSEKFKIRCYGALSWFLNLKIERIENKIILSQEAFMEKIIEKNKMSDGRTLETPLDVSSKLSKLEPPNIGSKEYQELQSCDYKEIVRCLN